MGVRILCIADVHLGRRPAHIPETIDARALGPAPAWHAFVRRAVELEVDAVALTGDVVDETNRFYEAFSVLQSGVKRLVDSGIPIFAVSGNHDFEVLPRLADRIPEFRLLGRGGGWEEAVLERDGVQVLRFQGWSFPRQYVRRNTLEDYAPPSDDLPTVALLHCDCDDPASRYGPVSVAELKAKAPTAWILGHVHKPGILSENLPLILYAGSPQGLDPSETGAHGAWLITLEAGRAPAAEMIPLAALRWEEVDVPLDEVSDEESLERAVIDALRATHGRISDETDDTKAVGCRLRLRGRTSLHRRLPDLVPTIQADLRPTFDDVEYFIEKVDDLSRPDFSLADIARSNDPAGLLAGRLILLERREPREAYRDLIRSAGRAIEKRRSNPLFASLQDSTDRPTEKEVRTILTKAGFTILDHLLAQKESRA